VVVEGGSARAWRIQIHVEYGLILIVVLVLALEFSPASEDEGNDENEDDLVAVLFADRVRTRFCFPVPGIFGLIASARKHRAADLSIGFNFFGLNGNSRFHQTVYKI
jgi:hypothetical protein